jgi:hypothetical protein
VVVYPYAAAHEGRRAQGLSFATGWRWSAIIRGHASKGKSMPTGRPDEVSTITMVR